jgi:hypothetical protein
LSKTTFQKIGRAVPLDLDFVAVAQISDSQALKVAD